MRAGVDKPEPRGRRDGQVLPGAVPVPPFEGEPSKLFGFSLPKRKKKEGVTLRTALVASGTAAALAVTGAGRGAADQRRDRHAAERSGR